MSRLTIDAKAEADIEDAARWYEAARAGLGFDFLNAVESAYRQITQGSERYPVWRTLSDRRAI